MPKYVVISNHPPNSCPSGNKGLKQASKDMVKDLPSMLKVHKIDVK